MGVWDIITGQMINSLVSCVQDKNAKWGEGCRFLISVFYWILFVPKWVTLYLPRKLFCIPRLVHLVCLLILHLPAPATGYFNAYLLTLIFLRLHFPRKAMNACNSLNISWQAQSFPFGRWAQLKAVIAFSNHHSAFFVTSPGWLYPEGLYLFSWDLNDDEWQTKGQFCSLVHCVSSKNMPLLWHLSNNVIPHAFFVAPHEIDSVVSRALRRQTERVFVFTKGRSETLIRSGHWAVFPLWIMNELVYLLGLLSHYNSFHSPSLIKKTQALLL